MCGESFNYLRMGEQILVMKFDDVLSIELNQKIQLLAEAVRKQQVNGVEQLMAAMNTLSIVYDPLRLTEQKLKEELQKINVVYSPENERDRHVIHIPVTFDGEYAPDLPFIAARAKMTTEETIDVFVSRTYYVYMMGFIAGIPYMGNIDDRLAAPRRSSPRLKVPKGSVAIANKMTDIYTIESPGGWHLIGWTPMEVFDAKSNPPCCVSAGMYVKYDRVSAAEAEDWSETRQKEWDEKWHI